ncbi:MAG: nucleoside triphosphate pyrophosphohydrolase, partial [Muribaculaceae bacterium]|nr:nucleoside triphosphate pyrophosphohydrolase [Muribaculaceae bacterium]
IKAYRIQEKAANVGFDWENKEDVWAKVDEEIGEFKAEVDKNDKDQMEEEMGDMFFALVNAARLYKITPENALEKTNRKFIARFSFIEDAAKKSGRKISDLTLEEMDQLWNKAKLELK